MMRRTEQGQEPVWVIYRLRDPSGPDEDRNRIYWPPAKPGWCTTEAGARGYAAMLNKAEKESAAPGAGTPEGGRAKC